ncbi:alpha/beta hydrolase [Streptomyces sp. JJ66]|uniref:alpha/beta fold hydrolase n=1 Tax=Streptomyces sp. JJ66 TaxID=2803843 RepID=UPI001C59EBDB|nr:alpha/beta hydrolase [Streptomyces sp. JJ66]MBW1604291.1 alpha/beta hydrolase [Streptomyces sp. JJ66]
MTPGPGQNATQRASASQQESARPHTSDAPHAGDVPCASGPPRERVRRLRVAGLAYAYRVLEQPRPRTEPLIVLGGALQGMYGWTHLEDAIGPVADVVTADLPGMGDSDPLRPEQDSALLCTAVAHIIDDLGVPRVNLFGYSYGSAIAFGYAQRRPERVARLVLGGVPAHITPAQQAHWGRAADQLAAGQAEAFADLAAESMLCADPARPVHRRDLAHRYVRRSLLRTVLRTPHAMAVLDRAMHRRLPLTGGLSGVPTLVFSGEHDTVSSPAHQRAFASTITPSTFRVIPETDHWAVLERPEAVADLTRRFLMGELLGADGSPGLPPGSRPLPTARRGAAPSPGTP